MKFPLLNEYDEQVALLNLEKPIELYKNLHTNAYSVRQGRVLFHTHNLSLRDVTFVVRQSGRMRVLASKTKNVHAFIKGWVCPTVESTDLLIRYNPYEADSFLCNGDKIRKAQTCRIEQQKISVQLCVK